MRTSDTTGKIFAALALVQSELKHVQKNKGVEVERSGSKTRSRYATLDSVHDACQELLTKHGIALTQIGARDDKGGERLLTVLAKDGEQIVSSFPVLAREGAQNFGGGLAFARRWGLACIVGVFASEDPDEATGYKNAAADARPASKSRAPAGLAAALDAIRNASSDDALSRAAHAARGAHPTGEASVAVERAIVEWFVASLGDQALTFDGFVALSDLQRSVKPHGGSSLRDAFASAERRVGPK